MKKILVPYDFSFAAKQAYKFAVDIATANSGEVIVVNVNELSTIYGNGMAGLPYSYIDPVAYSSELTDDLTKDFQDLKDVFEAPSVPVHFRVKTGNITDVILKEIEEEGIDLIVMGTAGASGMKEFFIGSNTEKIVRLAPVPVFVVHKPQRLSDIRHIVFPTSFDFNQNALVEKTEALQQFFDATLHLLYVITPDSIFSDKEAMTSLENYARFYDLDRYTLNIIHQGHERQGIVEFASELDHSMIAMATHGHKGITHLLMGSIAENVVNHAREQVWTYALG
jgi:nucleotide-binding universal stress UspA family protein